MPDDLFVPLDLKTHLSAVRRLLNASFRTVMDELSITRDMVPDAPAFADEESIRKKAEENHMAFFGLWEQGDLIACYAMRDLDPESAGLHRVAVRPDRRHRGLGSVILRDSARRAAGLGKKRIRLHMIDENTRLKEWYRTFGYKVTEIKKVENLPFTVCGMEYVLR